MFLALTGFWLIVVSLIAFIIILGLIIVLHEFGHFLVARKSGITCHEFSIGMGPAIYKHQFTNTLFCIRAIPIGGYVSMAGEEMTEETIKKDMKIGLILDGDLVTKINLDYNMHADIKGEVVDRDLHDKDGNGMYITIKDDSTGELKTFQVKEKALYVLDGKNTLQVTPYKECFDSKSLGKRFLTLFAGPFMNFVLAIVIYFIYFCCVGVPNYNSNIIGDVGYGYAGYNYLVSGDEIVSVNGVNVSSWEEFEIELDKYNASFPTSVKIGYMHDGVLVEENIEYSIIINSLGLSNLQNEEYKYPEGLNSGAIVGNVSLRYRDDKNKGEYPLSSGDVITKMRVDKYISSGYTTRGEEITINSWQDIVDNLKDVDIADVYFEYYSLEKAKTNDDPYVKLEDSAPLQTWGDETLNNQRIEKISLKLGISPTYHFSLGGVLASTFKGFWSDFTLIFRTLKLLIAPSGIRQVGVSDLSSVVGIFDMITTMVKNGFLPLLAFAAMLSVNIGIVNLLPIPALDGGRIVFLGYELVTRRKPNKRFEVILNNVFFILLMILFVYVTMNDISRLGFIINKII